MAIHLHLKPQVVYRWRISPRLLKEIDQTIFKTNFWRNVDQTSLTKEQVKVLNRMLDGDFTDGINTSQYHKVTKVSKPTATRHLTMLVELGCLVKSGAGRSTRYLLPRAPCSLKNEHQS